MLLRREILTDRKLIYNKEDARMTKGMAILCMLILHLFCRTGNDVLGTPLIWLDETTPLVYCFGFFAEICVPIYSLCVGYAQQYMSEQGILSWKGNLQRIKKLMINYWIVLVVFCILGLFFDTNHLIPGTLFDFLKSIFLLHSYNGAWWYLNTYIILLMIPSKILLWPVKKLKCKTGLIVCLLFQIGWYMMTRLEMISIVSFDMQFLAFVEKEVINLIGIIPYVWIGAFICKGKLVERSNEWLEHHIPVWRYNMTLMLAGGVLFVLTNLVHKSVLVGVVAILSFLIFNLLKKPESVKKVFLFLGKHSTNIWLTHMFFYACLFNGLVTIVKYPLLMLLFMILLCVVTSYVIMEIENIMCRILSRIK